MKAVRLMLVILPMLTVMVTSRLNAQELPRRVYLGIRMENLTEDMKNIMGLEDLRGVLIAEVLPVSTAKKAGFKKGDVDPLTEQK